jgi:hypothetical protein
MYITNLLTAKWQRSSAGHITLEVVQHRLQMRDLCAGLRAEHAVLKFDSYFHRNA